MMTTDQRAELDAAMKRATKGEWAQGHLLSTEQTRRFSFERRAYFSDIEKSTFYVDFSAEDEGRSRKRIGSTLECANDAHANAAAIVALHNAYPLLTATIDAQAAEIARLREAYSEAVSVLGLHTQYGCPVCPGDCSSANPPMMNCPTDAAKRVFGRFDAALASNGAA